MTVREIAKLAGVSPATISLVINNKEGVGDKKRWEILELLQKLNYPIKNYPSNLESENKNLLFIKIIKAGFLVEQNAGFIAKIIDSIQKQCSQNSYNLQMVTISENYAKNIKKLKLNNIQGAFILGTELQEGDYRSLDSIEIPYLVIDNSMPYYPCNSITMANVEMVDLAIKFLCSNGEKDFGYLRSSFDSQNFLERHIGVLTAVEKYGLSYSKEREFRLEATLKGSYNKMLEYIREGRKIPKVLFADNDILAIGAIQALTSVGYKIPEDISIVGFDDIFLAENTIPSLTTVHVQRTMIGQMAAITLINEIIAKHPSYYKLKVGGSLVLRNTTKTI
ncbi:MAG: LacI family DNA-binding transcriptional regulator [Sphaerochaetaceae bacterium]|nr:LacI family DNA-binding transcriptional regulator [Sphaerochaetaceae bacterium]